MLERNCCYGFIGNNNEKGSFIDDKIIGIHFATI